jgi:DNA-binding IclR family transcriptional regulator
MTTLTIDQEQKLSQPADVTTKFAGDLHSALEDLGERFGLYEVMTHSGPITPDCLATQVGIPEQSVRIWLKALAAENYLEHEVSTNLYSLWCSWLPDHHRGSR